MSQVELSQDTIKILKHLGEINQSIKIVPGQPLRTRTESRSLMATFKPREDFPRQFCIYDLREFIQVINLFEKPILDLSNERFATILDGSDASKKMRYLDADEELITSPDKDPNMPACEIELTLTEAQLDSVMSAASVLKLPYIGVQSDGDDVYLKAFHTNNGDDSETNSYSVRIADGDGSVYNMFLKSSAMMLLSGDYQVSISSKRISQFTSESRNLTYYLALEVDSEYSA